jgi:hypothetical protein
VVKTSWWPGPEFNVGSGCKTVFLRSCHRGTALVALASPVPFGLGTKGSYAVEQGSECAGSVPEGQSAPYWLVQTEGRFAGPWEPPWEAGGGSTEKGAGGEELRASRGWTNVL